MHPWTLYALEVSRDREQEIRNRLLLAEAPDDLKRSAAAVRRLDGCIADDLGRALAPSEQ